MKKTTRTSKRPHLTPQQVGRKYGFRSGLEAILARQIAEAGHPVVYEEEKIEYLVPERKARYTPDFKIYRKDGSYFYVESKGRFLTADRQKHLLIKDQFPDIEIRFVFSNSKQTISKQSKTTYAMWCEKHGFRFHDRFIPEEWLNE